jgi:hypothetical protein
MQANLVFRKGLIDCRAGRNGNTAQSSRFLRKPGLYQTLRLSTRASVVVSQQV